MPNIGPLELVVILVVVLLLFGAKRLPELGKSLGSGMREFKDSVTGKDSDDKAPTELEAGDPPQPADAAPRTEAPVEAEPRT
jgi:sec-independent protein translocase protein TatA